jgi:citrate lyase subunit beta/citryl-CoA lyase
MSTARIAPPRSLLFVPASRPDMVAKVTRWRPDVVVVDLEDAVAAAEKESARAGGIEAAEAVATGPSGLTVLVRVNPRGSRWFEDDLAAVAGSGVQGVVLPKYESVDDALAVREALPGTSVLLAGLETARGVAQCRELLGAAADVDAAYFGAEDYIVDVGGSRTAAGAEVLHARSEVLLAARLGGAAPVDQAVMEVNDDDRFVVDAEAGRSIGYTGKICVHPRQVALAHQVFAPSPADVEHARAVLVMAQEKGVGLVDGRMTDEVHVRWARQVLARVQDESGGR